MQISAGFRAIAALPDFCIFLNYYYFAAAAAAAAAARVKIRDA